MILIIDDDVAVCESAVLSLEMDGFEAGFCIDFKSAGKLFGQAQLIFLDITMPEVSGIQALKQIRKSFPRLPVVMFTGISDLNTAVVCMKMGAVDYLVKPVEPEVLCASALEHMLPQTQRTLSQGSMPDRNNLQNMLEKFNPEYFAGSAADDAADLAGWLAKRFAGSDCTLQKAAQELGTNTTYLSRIVSRQWDTSFRQLVNMLRQARFISLASQKADQSYSMDALAGEAGWSSRSKFYGAIKYLTGLTPTEVLSLFDS